MNRLITDYFDSTKDIFLHPTTTNILNEVRKEGNVSQLSQQDIVKFRQSLYDISRETEARILRGKRRHLAARKWISFAPGERANKRTHEIHTEDKFIILSFYICTREYIGL